MGPLNIGQEPTRAVRFGALLTIVWAGWSIVLLAAVPRIGGVPEHGMQPPSEASTKISETTNPHSARLEKKGGCWSQGTWYPEGSMLPPDPRSRIIAPGAFACRRETWVFEQRQR